MTVRLGLVGFGLAGGTLHAPVIATVSRLSIAGVVTSRGDDVRARYPDATVHASADALFADPGIDVAVIVTPNSQHAALARAALEAGKHVVVDKPFVTRTAEGAELIRLARARRRVLSVFHNRRWDGDLLTVASLLRSGRLGEVMLAEFAWDRYRTTPRDGWKEDPAYEGGLLADLGTHLIDQALLLFGVPDAVSADVATQREVARQDDYLDLSLHYGRRRVRLAGSTLAATPRPRFQLHGTGGSFVKHGIDPQEAVLRSHGRADTPGFGEEDRSVWGVFTAPDGTSELVRSERGRWAGFYEGLAAAIEDGAPAPVNPVDALAGLRLIELARESAASGRRVAVDAGALRAV